MLIVPAFFALITGHVEGGWALGAAIAREDVDADEMVAVVGFMGVVISRDAFGDGSISLHGGSSHRKIGGEGDQNAEESFDEKHGGI